MHSLAVVENSDILRRLVTKKLDPAARSALGQFMTPAPIARFMASLFADYGGKDIRLLDPGAGLGALSAAFVEDAAARDRKPQSIDLTAYEVDDTLAGHLETTLDQCWLLGEAAGFSVKAAIAREDFIEAGATMMGGDLLSGAGSHQPFTHVIMNPPYKKIQTKSPHRKWLRSVGIETSNLYTGFMAMAIHLLEPKGELVAIVPRSFCNGPYFRPFREFMLREMALRHVHIFGSRTHAFKEDEVLQENIILHAVKGGERSAVRITSSQGPGFSLDEESGELVTEDLTVRDAPMEAIVKPSDPQKFFYFAATDFEQSIVDSMAVFTETLEDLDLTVSTGPVVDFRLKEDTRKEPEPETVPLLYAGHFGKDGLTWPKAGKKPNAIHVTDRSRRWLMPNTDSYLITKRFTSKEEKRRLVAWVYDSSLPGELVGFENHLNVFHRDGHGIPADEAAGLGVYLNSTLLDKFFRLFNGHTQVNATDLRSLKYPDRSTLRRWGRKAARKRLDQDEIDTLVDEAIGRMSDNVQQALLPQQRKIEQALEIVIAMGFPRGQQNERSALTLLALLDLSPEQPWKEAERPLIGITPVMDFCRDQYGKNYAPNTRETFRRQTMHQFVAGGLAVLNPDQPDRPVNSPKNCYQITPEAYEAIIHYGTDKWEEALAEFLKERETLAQRYAMEREMAMIPVRVDGDEEIRLTPGEHSKLIRDIIEDFGARFVRGGDVIYVGDTGDKIGYFQDKRLADLGVEVDQHGKMPDVVLYDAEREWLLLIEAVTSHGPVDGKRHAELSELFAGATPGLVYVTAFPDRPTMAKYLTEICWETEVWTADAPTHLIHFNGERFLGPYER